MSLFVLVLVAAFSGHLFAADSAPEPQPPDYPEYELRSITAKPGKLDDIHAWLRDHQDDVLAKHGVASMGFFVPAGENPNGLVLCLYKYPSLPAAVVSWRALRADPLWKPMDASSGLPESLIASETRLALKATDYSPEFIPAKAAKPRVFELRTYTCPTREHCYFLHERFRNHTIGLFEKHGMTNVVYWKPMGTDESDRKLVYLLAHDSEAAAKESFAAFRKDPDWIAAKEASEKAAGGSLTNKEGGVMSEFLVGTEYSPLR